MAVDGEWNWEDRYEQRGVDDELRQGDIIDATNASLDGLADHVQRFVVLNQSCDLARQRVYKKTQILVPKANTIFVARVDPVRDFYRDEIARRRKLKNIDSFRKALWWNHECYAYLPPSPDHGQPLHLIAVIEELHTLDIWTVDGDYPDLSRYAELQRLPRIGLSSPWSERLGWMLAHACARVATPDPANHERPALEERVGALAAKDVE